MNGDGEAIGQQHQPLLDPDLSVFEGLSSVMIDSAQECAAYAALHAVENPGLTGRDQRRASLSHATSIYALSHYYSQKSLIWMSGNCGTVGLLV